MLRNFSKAKAILKPNKEELLYLEAMNQYKDRICLKDFLKSWDIV